MSGLDKSENNLFGLLDDEWDAFHLLQGDNNNNNNETSGWRMQDELQLLTACPNDMVQELQENMLIKDQSNNNENGNTQDKTNNTNKNTNASTTTNQATTPVTRGRSRTKVTTYNSAPSSSWVESHSPRSVTFLDKSPSTFSEGPRMDYQDDAITNTNTTTTGGGIETKSSFGDHKRRHFNSRQQRRLGPSPNGSGGLRVLEPFERSVRSSASTASHSTASLTANRTTSRPGRQRTATTTTTTTTRNNNSSHNSMTVVSSPPRRNGNNNNDSPGGDHHHDDHETRAATASCSNGSCMMSMGGGGGGGCSSLSDNKSQHTPGNGSTLSVLGPQTKSLQEISAKYASSKQRKEQQQQQAAPSSETSFVQDPIQRQEIAVYETKGCFSPLGDLIGSSSNNNTHDNHDKVRNDNTNKNNGTTARKSPPQREPNSFISVIEPQSKSNKFLAQRYGPQSPRSPSNSNNKNQESMTLSYSLNEPSSSIVSEPPSVKRRPFLFPATSKKSAASSADEALWVVEPTQKPLGQVAREYGKRASESQNYYEEQSQENDNEPKVEVVLNPTIPVTRQQPRSASVGRVRFAQTKKANTTSDKTNKKNLGLFWQPRHPDDVQDDFLVGLTVSVPQDEEFLATTGSTPSSFPMGGESPYDSLRVENPAFEKSMATVRGDNSLPQSDADPLYRSKSRPSSPSQHVPFMREDEGLFPTSRSTPATSSPLYERGLLTRHSSTPPQTTESNMTDDRVIPSEDHVRISAVNQSPALESAAETTSANDSKASTAKGKRDAYNIISDWLGNDMVTSILGDGGDACANHSSSLTSKYASLLGTRKSKGKDQDDNSISSIESIESFYARTIGGCRSGDVRLPRLRREMGEV